MRLQVLEDRCMPSADYAADQRKPFTPLPTVPTSALSAAVNILRRLFAIASPHPSGLVLRRPPETTTQSRRCHVGMWLTWPRPDGALFPER
jgi:hypothetical protein